MHASPSKIEINYIFRLLTQNCVNGTAKLKWEDITSRVIK